MSPIARRDEEKACSAHVVVHGIIASAVTSITFLPPVYGTAIIENTIPTLQRLCLLFTVVQILTYVFQPTALTHTSNSKKILAKKFQTVVLGVCSYVVSVFTFYIVAFLFGAPLIERASETFHFALFVSTLMTIPLNLHVGSSPVQWARTLLGNWLLFPAEQHARFVVCCTAIGTWLGAVPIPLDWDRPWQVWPITCCIGAMLGYIVGNVASAIVALLWYRKQKHKRQKAV